MNLYNPFVGRQAADMSWTPESKMWLELYYPYRLNMDCRPLSNREEIFHPIKDAMQSKEDFWGVYREEWTGHVNQREDRSTTHSWYFKEKNNINQWIQQYGDLYMGAWQELTLSGWIRGTNDERLDPWTLETFTMQLPHAIQISIEHDGVDIQDWLIESGMVHGDDWKAIAMRHKGVYEIYFRDAGHAIMTKLRWGGIGF